MSEKSFRTILIVVVVVWVVFVLVPALADFMPRAWANVQYFLPGSTPRVTIIVKDGPEGEAIADARVQIVTEQTAFVAVTDKNGQAVFEAVPAGRALTLRVQKLDYEIVAIASPAIPHRQRARFDIVIKRTFGQRLYVAHETASNTFGFSLLDVSSRIVMSPPGATSGWENVPAGDVRFSAFSQRLFILATDRLITINTADGSRAGDTAFAAIAGGLALDPNGESVYVVAAGAGGRGRWLTALMARSGAQRFSVQVSTTANSVSLLVSPDGQRLYLIPIGEQNIMVFDARTGQRTEVYPLGDRVKDAAIARDGQTIYVLTERGQVPLAVNLSGNARATPVLDQVPENALAGATRLIVAEYQLHRWLCLLQPASRQVVIIDINDHTLQTVSVGREPSALAPATSADQIYVANKGSNNLAVISLNDHTVIDEIDVRSRPALLVSPQ